MRKLIVALAMVVMCGGMTGCSDIMYEAAKGKFDRANTLTSFNRCYEAYQEIYHNINSAYDDIKIQSKNFLSQESFGECLKKDIENISDTANNIDTNIELINSIYAMHSINSYISKNSTIIEEYIKNTTIARIISRDIKIDFANINSIPGIKNEKTMPIAYTNSLNTLKNSRNSYIFDKLLDSINDKYCIDCTKNFKKDMYHIKYDKNMLNNKKFITFAGNDYQKISNNALKNVVIIFDQSDKLTGFDTINILKNNDGIRIVDKNTNNTITVKVDKLEYNITTMPEQINNIMYAQYQCDLGVAITMPQGASYIYDHISGGSRIDYAYMVTIFDGSNKIKEEVIRNSISDYYSYCKNARIQNVFGGVFPATVMANGHMQNQCSGTQTQSDSSALKKRVPMELATALASMLLDS